MDLLERIDNLQVQDPQPTTPYKLRKIKLTNQIAILCAGLAAPYFVIFGAFKLHIAQALVIPTVAIYLASLLFNRFKRHDASKLSIIIGTSIVLLVYANLLGEKVGAQLLLFALLPIPLLLFEADDRVQIATGMLTPLICSFALEFSHFSLFGLREYLAAPTEYVIHNFAILTTFLLIGLSALVNFIENKKYEKLLETKNLELNDNIEVLQQAYKEVKVKRSMDQELEAAREIQIGIVPDRAPAAQNFQLNHWFLPAKQVGGDYFDYLVFSQNRIGIIIADIVGKGIPGSLMMLALRNSLHTFIDKNDSPAKALEKLNPIIYHHRTIQKYVPMCYGILDIKKQTFTYANGGHEPGLLLTKDGGITELSTGGCCVGMYERAEFEEEEIALSPGDRVVLLTDGLTDIKDKNGHLFGIEGLKVLLQKYTNQKENHFIENVSQEIITRHASQTQTDDITFISIYNPMEQN